MGKANPEHSLGPERLEDALTDGVFSAVRYLPRRILGALLVAAVPGLTVSPADLEGAVIELWPTMASGLWVGRRVEPDVVVHVGRHVIAFEAKYHSGFGSYEVHGVRDVQQLAVQWEALTGWAAARGASATALVAVTTDATEPADVGVARRQLAATVPGGQYDGDTVIRWMPWQRIAACLREAAGLAVHEKEVISDVLRFMDRRGVSRVFNGFDVEDYERVAAAHQIAVDRLYPTISTFVQNLTSALDADGIDWGWPQKGMWTDGGLGWTNPGEWGRDHFTAAYWPRAWPVRAKADRIALYVTFDLHDPAVEFGFVWKPVPSTVASSGLSALASQLAALGATFDVAVSAGDWTNPAQVVPTGEATAAWFGGLSGQRHLRLQHRSPVGEVTDVDIARRHLLEVKEAVEACPALHSMLLDGGLLRT